ncbi:MAG: energy transducer TonB [Proteobacteria bacterium]|nr:energy transducer TonB [Pseudomonadota bacterium]
MAKFDPGDAYPAEAEEKEIEGSATVVVQVDASGRVTEASVTSASNPVFRSSSVTREARSVRFTPAQNKDCEKVGGSYSFNVVFRLD